MANNWDASIKLISPVDKGTEFTADTVVVNTAFDALANVEVGQGLHQFTQQHTVIVWVRNLSQSTTVEKVTKSEKLPAVINQPFNAKLTLPIAAIPAAKAAVGDVLELLASYTVEAGANTDFSQTTSQLFQVVDVA